MEKVMKILEKIVAVATVVTQLMAALLSVKKSDSTGGEDARPAPTETSEPSDSTEVAEAGAGKE